MHDDDAEEPQAQRGRRGRPAAVVVSAAMSETVSPR
jgi:hypothetical protein